MKGGGGGGDAKKRGKGRDGVVPGEGWRRRVDKRRRMRKKESWRHKRGKLPLR